MTRAQLADRIHQMEATASRNSTVGAPRDRHRPMEDRRRHDKIYAYQEELARRIAADAAQAQADAREHDQSAQPPRCAECAETGRTAYACTGLESERPLCAKHGAAAAASRHAKQQQQPPPAATAGAKENTPVHINDFARAEEDYRDDPDIQQLRDGQRAAAANARFQRDTHYDEQGSPSDPPCSCRCDGDQADASGCEAHSGRIPRVALQGPTPVIRAPRKPRRTRAARPAPTPEIAAIGTGPTHIMQAAEAVAEIQRAAAEPELPELDRAIEALVARYTCGSVIDAAWEASHRLFRPGQTKGGAA
jgi:hypothetical protein